MTRLLRTEWLKHNRSAYTLVVLLVTTLVYVLLAFTFERFLRTAGGPAGSVMQKGFGTRFPFVWYYVPLAASYFKLFPGLVLIQAVCMEFTNRTARQHIIDGMSRREFVISKLLTVLGVAALITIVITLIAAVVGLTSGPAGKSSDNYIQFLLLYFYELCCYLSFVTMLSFIFRRALITVFVLIIYVIFIETLLGSQVPIEVKRWFPVTSINGLVHDPFNREVTLSLQVPFHREALTYIRPGIYAVLFWVVSFFRFEKSNL